MPSTPLQVAVIGGGNGAYAATADFTQAGHAVRLWRRDPATLPTTITLRDATGAHPVTPALATADLAAAVRGADLVLCPIPAPGQPEFAAALAPHLTDGQVVFLPPGTLGAVLLAHTLHATGRRPAAAFAETGTLPWLARRHGDAEVAITARATRLPTGVFPASRAPHALATLARAFPDAIEPCGDALSAALMNAGPIIHPPLILMNAGPLEHFPQWDIHNEGTQPSIRRVTTALDAERIAIRAALGYPAPHFPLADHYATTGDEWMYGRAAHARLTESNDWRERIPLTTHRYMHEDVLLGLALLASAADLAGVPAPLARAFLALGRAVTGDPGPGRTLATVGLGGLDRAALSRVLWNGFA